MSDDEPAKLSESLRGLVARPEIGRWTVVFVVAGLAGAFWFGPDSWSVARKIAAGGLFGVGATFCLLLPRMIGGHDYN